MRARASFVFGLALGAILGGGAVLAVTLAQPRGPAATDRAGLAGPRGHDAPSLPAMLTAPAGPLLPARPVLPAAPLLPVDAPEEGQSLLPLSESPAEAARESPSLFPGENPR